MIVANTFSNGIRIMPTINKGTKKKQVKQGRSKEASEIYNTSRWKKLRSAYLMLHPLCEMCLEEEKISPTEEVHHIKPILTGESRLEMEQLAYNPSNLIALCKEHHHQIHNNLRSKD